MVAVTTHRPATLIADAVDHRLAWQRPRAIVCSVLLLVFVAFGAMVWRALIKTARERQSEWTAKDFALLTAGVVAGPVCLVLMIMAIRNTQASFAPLTMTLFFG